MIDFHPTTGEILDFFRILVDFPHSSIVSCFCLEDSEIFLGLRDGRELVFRGDGTVITHESDCWDEYRGCLILGEMADSEDMEICWPPLELMEKNPTLAIPPKLYIVR